jgi:hypothetical protein
VNWQQIAVSIAVLVLYCSWLGLRPWFPRASRNLLLIVNLATALGVVLYDVTPLRDVLEDWRLQAIVAFELVTAAAAIAAFLGNRAALFFSYLAFAIHFSAIVWVFSHPLRFDKAHLLDYG